MKSCPHDALPLKPETRGGVTIDRCAACAGIWFDSGELEKMKRIDEPYLQWLRFDLFKESGKFGAERSARRCPADGASLHRISYEASRIQIDICGKCHGIWLDGGEYGALRAYLHEKVNREHIADFLSAIGGEMRELVSGEESIPEAVSDVLMITKLLEYRILARWPVLTRLIRSLPF